jgi:predicted CopG family antitoxin
MVKKRNEVRMTTIQISTETRDELQKRGRKGDTYDDVIKELLKRA